MNIPANVAPSELLLGAHLVWLLVLAQALRRAPWGRLRAGAEQHMFLGSVVVLLLLWSLDAGARPGLGFHFLGVTVLTLMFGWSLAVIGASLASLGLVLSDEGTLGALALNALLLGMLPVSVSYGIYRLVDRCLPHHVFVYIFLCAFLGGIVSTGVAVLALVGVLAATDAYSMAQIAAEYLPFLPLYLFPEGVLNGMLTTVLVGLRPEWLLTFDDDAYLRGK